MILMQYKNGKMEKVDIILLNGKVKVVLCSLIKK